MKMLSLVQNSRVKPAPPPYSHHQQRMSIPNSITVGGGDSPVSSPLISPRRAQASAVRGGIQRVPSLHGRSQSESVQSMPVDLSAESSSVTNFPSTPAPRINSIGKYTPLDLWLIFN
jgi:hypothetical protein